MALEVFDGFDHYNSAVDLQERSGVLQWTDSGTVSIVRPGRFAYGACILVNAVGGSEPSLSGLHGSLSIVRTARTFGFAAIPPIDNRWYVRISNSGNGPGAAATIITLKFDYFNCRITAYNGDLITGPKPIIGASTNNAFVTNSWQYFEIQYDSTIIIHVNGEEALNVAFGSQDWDSFIISNNAPGTGTYVDDFYETNAIPGPGPSPFDSFMGDVRTQTLFAIGDSGTIQWSPQPNTNANWQNISEVAMDSDGTYNYTSLAGNEDLFNFQSLIGVTPLPLAVQLTGAYRKDDAGLRLVQQQLISGMTTTGGATFTLGTGYAYFTDMFVLNPDGDVPWTDIAVDALSAGYLLVT